MKCPVCNKAGIPPETTTCPDCGSDIEAIVFITRLDENLRRVKKNLTVASVVIALVVIALIIRTYTLYNDRTEGRVQIEKFKKENNALQLKVDSLSALIKSAGVRQSDKQMPVVTENGKTETHIVKPGDSLWKLAQRYLGDGNKYSKIASDNNLEKPYVLREGQELKIAISK